MAFSDNSVEAALQSLKPAIAPQPLPWWPPAPGWWLVAIILLCLLVLVSVYGWRRRAFLRATRYQREASSMLGQVLNKKDTLVQLQEIAQIMRRAAISAYGRESAGTQPWSELAQRVELDASAHKKNRVNTAQTVLDTTSLDLLGNALYQNRSPTPEEIHHLLQKVNTWLEKLPPHQETRR